MGLGEILLAVGGFVLKALEGSSNSNVSNAAGKISDGVGGFENLCKKRSQITEKEQRVYLTSNWKGLSETRITVV